MNLDTTKECGITFQAKNGVTMSTDQSVDTVQYYRSTIIRHEPGTTVYWAEDNIGRQWDVDCDLLPEGASVIDVTDDHTPEPNPEFIVRNGILEQVA